MNPRPKWLAIRKDNKKSVVWRNAAPPTPANAARRAELTTDPAASDSFPSYSADGGKLAFARVHSLPKSTGRTNLIRTKPMKRYVNQILASAFIATGALGILLSPWTVFTLWHDDYRWIGSNGVAGRLDDAD